MKITGEQVWLKAIQDTADNLATGITLVKQWGDYVFAVGGHESNDYTLVFYMLNFETGELTDSPKKIDVNATHGDVPAGAKIVLNHPSQVRTYYAANSSIFHFFPGQEVGGQFDGLSRRLLLYFDTSTHTITRFNQYKANSDPTSDDPNFHTIITSISH